MTKTSKAYLHAIVSLLEEIEEKEQQSITKAADILAKKVSEGRLINVIGTGGHSNMAVEEVFWRAGGLAAVNGILDAGTNLIHGAKRSNFVERTPGYARSIMNAYRIHEGDVLIIVNAYGINSFSIDCALECEEKKITSIGITSTSFADSIPMESPARHPSGKNLHELADIFIDNHLPFGDAVVEVDGIEQNMGPTSTFVNSFTINLLMIRTAEKLVEMGVEVPVWTSANLPRGDKMNKKLEDSYIPRVKHLL